jgi:hypothetical protein
LLADARAVSKDQVQDRKRDNDEVRRLDPVGGLADSWLCTAASMRSA